MIIPRYTTLSYLQRRTLGAGLPAMLQHCVCIRSHTSYQTQLLVCDTGSILHIMVYLYRQSSMSKISVSMVRSGSCCVARADWVTARGLGAAPLAVSERSTARIRRTSRGSTRPAAHDIATVAGDERWMPPEWGTASSSESRSIWTLKPKWRALVR